MSYVREVTGEWEIQPGLPWNVYRNLPQTQVNGDTAFSIVELRKEIDQEEGQFIRRLAVGIRPRSAQSYEHPQPELAALAQLCRQQSVTVVGTIYSVGEDGPLDTWRYYTDATGNLVCDQAILVWPDGKRAYQVSGQYLTLGDSGPVAWPAPISPDRIIKGSPWQR